MTAPQRLAEYWQRRESAHDFMIKLDYRKEASSMRTRTELSTYFTSQPLA